MLRSLFSGISGLRAHQTMLDVTGNNIANVNTTGFKASTVQFEDTLSQLIAGASAAQDGNGGTNPAQIGLGVKVAGVATNTTQGSPEQTNVATDMMIVGDGYFVVSQNGQRYYTRDGAFTFDSAGNVTLNGAEVQGWMATDGVVDTTQGTSDLKIPVSALMAAKQTTTSSYAGNLEADAATGTSISRTETVYDSTGAAGTLSLQFTKGATGWTVSSDGGATTTPVVFNAAGNLTSPTSLTASVTTADGAVVPVKVDMSAVTGFSGIDTIKPNTQDGYAAGTLTSFTLGSDGTITGTFSNGRKQTIGQIALANFNNPAGLEKAGDSLYTTSVNSGAAQIGTAGTGGRGTLTGGALEMSNVDLSSEFTNLIIAQRGFQANSRVITTSDTILQELINLKQ